MSSTPSRPRPGGTFTYADRTVARVGFGMGRVTRWAGTAPDGYAGAVALLRHAFFDLGVSHFDSGHFYGHGLANRMLAEALRGYRDEAVVATKVGLLSVPGGQVNFEIAQRPHQLREAVEVNLATLATDQLDVVYLRRMDYTPGPLAAGDHIVPIEDQLAEMIKLRDEGKIRGIGLSHITEAQLRTAVPAGIASVQNIYHVFDRTFEPLVDLCRDNDIPWIPFFPRGSNSLMPDTTVSAEPTIGAIAERVGATRSQITLAWQLAHSPNTMLIPGTASVSHLDENTAAADIALDADDMRALDNLV